MTISRIKITQSKPVKLPNPCKHCGTIGHSSMQCGKKPRKPLKSSKGLSAKKKIKPIGTVGKQWIKTRKEWFKQNPPDHAGYYYCYICGLALLKTETTLDHKQSRGRNPELRNDLNNLAPCCSPCNTDKGSYNIDEYLKRKEMHGRK